MIGLEGLLVFFFWTRWQSRQPGNVPKPAEDAA